MKFASIFLGLVYLGGALAFVENIGPKGYQDGKMTWTASVGVVVWPFVISHLAVEDYMRDYKWRHH